MRALSVTQKLLGQVAGLVAKAVKQPEGLLERQVAVMRYQGLEGPAISVLVGDIVPHDHLP